MGTSLHRRRTKPFFRLPAEDHRPIAAINTTPLIDMMLVLLILFIVAIPMRTHQVPLDLPQPGAAPGPERPVHRLAIDAAGRTWWDGRALSAAQLRGRLAAHVADPAEPVLHLDADAEARYERVDEVLADVRRAGVTRLGFVDTARFAGAFAF